ncbi:conserved hypothetical protein [Streptomyces sp. SPB78]|nr:conserved hypothetical protein [Streptomyces sp. SPB78]
MLLLGSGRVYGCAGRAGAGPGRSGPAGRPARVRTGARARPRTRRAGPDADTRVPSPCAAQSVGGPLSLGRSPRGGRPTAISSDVWLSPKLPVPPGGDRGPGRAVSFPGPRVARCRDGQ